MCKISITHMRNCVMGAMHMHLTQDTTKESDKNTIKRNT